MLRGICVHEFHIAAVCFGWVHGAFEGHLHDMDVGPHHLPLLFGAPDNVIGPTNISPGLKNTQVILTVRDSVFMVDS